MRKVTYIFLNDDAHLLDGAAELVEGNLAFVVDVEELEGLRQEGILLLIGGALLDQLSPQFSLEAGVSDGSAYSFRMRCMF